MKAFRENPKGRVFAKCQFNDDGNCKGRSFTKLLVD